MMVPTPPPPPKGILAKLEHELYNVHTKYKDVKRELRAVVDARESEERFMYIVHQLKELQDKKDALRKELFQHCLKSGHKSKVLEYVK